MSGTERKLHGLGAVEVAGRIRAGELTSVALTQACLTQIAERDPQIGAWVHLDAELALAQARAADQRQTSGQPTGPLNGVPVGVKDVIATADMPTQYGSALFAGHQPSEDSAVVTALRQAGAVILGKTVTTELAALNPSATRNPNNAAHTPGGSSAGSAAAVAAGMVPLALGTQTAGSVIRPASFCGVVGFKPTFGLISRAGMKLQSHTLDTIGVMGRSIEDVVLAMECVAGHDPRDPANYPRGRMGLSALLAVLSQGTPRLAFWGTPAWGRGEPQMREAMGGLLAALGSRIRDIELPGLFERVLDWQAAIQAAENALHYGEFLRERPGDLSEKLRGRLEASLQVRAADYLEALLGREQLIGLLGDVFGRYDAIVCPAAPGPAPRDLGTTGDPVFNGLWTYLGVPAVTLPLLDVGGMPLGVQLVGAPRNDGRLLGAAQWLMRTVGGGLPKTA